MATKQERVRDCQSHLLLALESGFQLIHGLTLVSDPKSATIERADALRQLGEHKAAYSHNQTRLDAGFSALCAEADDSDMAPAAHDDTASLVTQRDILRAELREKNKAMQGLVTRLRALHMDITTCHSTAALAGMKSMRTLTIC
jgi:hypothetical protein